RVRPTGKQAERSNKDRIEFMKDNPFIVLISPFRRSRTRLRRASLKEAGGGCSPSSILLIDDVWTTGATIGAASEALKKSGVEKIWTCTLAKG
ncbi:hypothetical protein KJ673_03980, partial [Patescibacteria group bacterium]|nr:hypothetical protein [Patescibacteria group bacterium]MCG2687659.1 hypothetical protein [Candidatus Parcubacteria bacterium]